MTRRLITTQITIAISEEDWTRRSGVQLERLQDRASAALRDTVGGLMPSMIDGAQLTVSMTDLP